LENDVQFRTALAQCCSLAATLDFFRIPELHFEADVAAKLGGRLDNLLKRIKKGRRSE
jgi:ribosome-binding factor A